MIELIFYFGTEIIMVRINQNHITFVNSVFGAVEAPIENLRLNRAGVIKEFPDLDGNPNWREEAIKRFKDKIKTLQTEDAIAEYITFDLKKFGYLPKWKQKKGFRREALK